MTAAPHKNHTGQGRTGLDRIGYAFVHSYHGLAAAWRGESAFRQESALAAVLLPGAFWLGRNWVEVALLAGVVALVLIVELLNTGIETVVDRIGLEPHELSGRAKDMGSAAVLFALLLAGGVWATALWQRFAG